MIRKLSIGIAVAVGLLLVAAAALLAIVDVNRFKPQIEQTVQERLHRRLAIDGDLSLAVFPRIAVALPRTTLSQRTGDGELLSLDSARVGIALWPLLRGRFEVDRIRIAGLKATIVRAADGSSNVDDLLESEDKAGTPQTTAAKKAEFEIGGIELDNAEITLRDHGNTITLSKLALKTGRIAPRTRTKLDLATHFSASRAKANGEATASAALDIDLGQHAYTAESLAVTAKGDIDQKAFDLQLNIPKLAIGKDTVSGEKITAALKLGGADPGELKVALAGFSGSSGALRVDMVDLGANVRQGARRVAAAVSSPAQANLDTQTLQLPKLTGQVTIDDPTLPQKTVKMPIAGAVALDAKKQAIDVRLDTKFDDTTLNLKLDVVGFDKPRLAFDVRADQIDIDRYAPPRTAPTGSQGAATDPKIDLSALRSLNASGQVQIGRLQARGVKATAVRLGLKAAGGRAEIAPMSAALYEGTLSGTARAAADGNRVALDATLNGISIGPLLRDVLEKDPLEGRGNVKLDVATAGATIGAMKHALDGSASIALRDGAIRGINLAQKLREARAMLPGARTETQRASGAAKTDFSEMTANFVIRDGVASNNDLDLKSPLLRLGGAGRIDIGASTLDYTARVSVVGTLTGQDGRALTELRGVTVPVRLSGPFDQMSYAIDWGGVAKEALKSKLTEQLQQRLLPQKPDAQKTPEDRARDLLKGLLGR